MVIKVLSNILLPGYHVLHLRVNIHQQTPNNVVDTAVGLIAACWVQIILTITAITFQCSCYGYRYEQYE